MTKHEMVKEKSSETVIDLVDSHRGLTGWKTLLFNCDCHTFHEVAIQLTKAVGCPYEKGMQLANVVHHTGCAIVYSGSKEHCEAVSAVLEEIGLRAQVSQ